MEVEKLRSDESELSGRWIWDGETMQRDSTEQRIQALIDHQLERIADGDGGGQPHIATPPTVDIGS
jgi:hypothetical protein